MKPMQLPLIYVAHPFGGDMVKLADAERWVAYLCQNFDAIFWAPWIPLCAHWPDSGESRKRGLELDLEAVRRSDGVILVGGEVSPGMQLERTEASAVFDWSIFRSHREFCGLDCALRSSVLFELQDWLVTFKVDNA